MALLDIEGFEGFQDGGDRTDLDVNYNFDSLSAAEAGVSSPGRAGGRYAFIAESSGSSVRTMEYPISHLASGSTWIFGIGFKLSSTFYDSSIPIIQFIDVDSSELLSLYVSGSTLIVKRGATTLGGASASFITTVWYHVEIKVTFHASTGSIVIRLHEQEVLNLTNQNTTATGNTRPYAVRFGTTGSSQSYLDDIYICDDTGGTHDDFLGDNLAERISPNGNGTTNNFTGSDADSTDNYLLVDDSDPDDDTTYVQSGTSGHKDLYAFESISTTPTAIEAVAVKSYAKKTDAGSLTFVHVCRSSTTESDSSAIAPSTDYQFHPSIYTVDPDTSVAWTEAGINAAEFGVKLS